MARPRKETKEPQTVCCFTCRKALLMQWDDNPVIATCNQEFRSVANTMRRCAYYKPLTPGTIPQIKKLTHYK